MSIRSVLKVVATGITFLYFATAPASYATAVWEIGDPFSGSLLRNPVAEQHPVELTITLNSASPKTITCTIGSVRGSVPGAPANPNFITNSASGSVQTDSATSLSLGGCTYTGGQPMSESGNGIWPLTWNVFSGAPTDLAAIGRIPAGFNFIGQYGESPCTVILGPNEAQSIVGRWFNQSTTVPASITFSNQELMASASTGCAAGAVDTADLSAAFSASDEATGHLLRVSLQ